MNYEELTDRELDALVAEKVMGAAWTNVGPNPNIARIGGPVDCWAWKIGGRFYFDKDEFPRYSTDIAAAWSVVEKIRKTLHVNISTHPDTLMKDEAFHVLLERIEYGERKTLAHSMTFEFDGMPRAICLAALKASEES